MKNLTVLVASAGLSGSGLISDFLLSRSDFVSPFKKKPDSDQQSEFRFITDPGGLISLYKGFYDNFSINNCAYVYHEFNKYLNNLKKFSIKKANKKKYLYDQNFYNEILKFEKNIIKIQYYGLPQFHRIGLNKKSRLLWRFQQQYKSAQQTKFFKMVLPVDRKKFIIEAQKMIKNYLFLKANKKNVNFVLDQSINFCNPLESSNFFSNSKVILVTRDPRSVYSSMKTRKSLSYPGHNVIVFINWYNYIMKKFSKIKKNKNLKIIKYENFILNHGEEKRKLLRFLKLQNKQNSIYNVKSSKKNIFKAKENLTKYELNIIKKKLKRYLQWPKD